MMVALLKENWIACSVCLSDTDSGSFSLRLLVHLKSLKPKQQKNADVCEYC